MAVQAESGWKLHQARFAGDTGGRQAIQADPELRRMIDGLNHDGHAAKLREHFLSHAVRIDTRVLPDLARAFADTHERSGIDQPFEAYVYAEPSINAYVVRGHERMFIVLSSGAVERLTAGELDFVIGHELGHAAFGHLDVPVMAVLQTNGNVQRRQAMQLLAWQRTAEISADRAGLMCCGSLDVAANALFKTLSGLALNVNIDPQEFAGQWNELSDEVERQGSSDLWHATHPFPPLRMKALISFWNSDRAAELIEDAPGGQAAEHADREVNSLLAMMDPLARESSDTGDPMLRQFFLWGGLYVATAEGEPHSAVLTNIGSQVGAEALGSALACAQFSHMYCRDQFHAARKDRRKPLSALELHRLFSGLVQAASASGPVGSPQLAALGDLARACGVSESFIHTVLSKAA